VKATVKTRCIGRQTGIELSIGHSNAHIVGICALLLALEALTMSHCGKAQHGEQEFCKSHLAILLFNPADRKGLVPLPVWEFSWLPHT
jgi:hypothetical protein